MLDTIYTLKLPAIYCPFPETLNENADNLERHTAQWVLDFKLLNGSTAVQRYDVSKFSRLVARACPTGRYEELTIASDLMALLFLLDDHCDEATIGKQPERLMALFGEMLFTAPPLFADTPEVLLQSVATANPSLERELIPILAAMKDIWQRLNRRATPDWIRRFVGNLRDSVQANTWEAHNRANRVRPDLATYISKRALTNGFYWCQDLTELVEGIELPAEVRESAEIRRLAQTATNVTGWFNDIVSLHKEINYGDVHNLVLILQNHYQLPDLQTALNRAVEMHNDQVRSFMALEQALPSFGASLDREVKRYVDAMRWWMRSNVDWSFESGRYHQWQQSQDGLAFSDTL